MKQILFTLFIALTMLPFGYAQPTNTNISNGLIFDGEPYIAINPTNAQNLVAAWMGFKLSGGSYHIAIKTRASFDGGTTWSVANALPHYAAAYGAADPTMAFSKTGTLYIAYIDYRQTPDSGGVYVARSTDGGLNWDTPSKAFDAYDVAAKRPIDRPWLVIDNSNSANAGTLYITTKPAPWVPAPNRNYFKMSTDGGHTWSTITNVDGGSHLVGSLIQAPMAAPSVSLGGSFLAAYPSYVSTQNVLPCYYLAKSKDKGQTFTYTTIYAAIPAANDTNFKNGYQLLANPIDSNKMVLLLPNAQNGDDDISALSSNDGGQTWTAPIRINDDALGNGKAQDLVWGAYNEVGNLVVTWRDRRDASATGFWNAGYDFYYAVSTNNGQSFLPNQKLSSQFIPFDSVIAQNGNDFMSCAYQGDNLYTVWGDTRNGKMNIYFAKTIASTNINVQTFQLDGNPDSWQIAPNPTGDFLFISLTGYVSQPNVSIYDINGKKLYTNLIHDKTIQINTTFLPAGIYIIKINNEAKRFIKK